MKLINLSLSKINQINHPYKVETIERKFRLEISDILYRIADGEFDLPSIRCYIDTLGSKTSSDNIIVPFIKDISFMRRILTLFNNSRYRVWIEQDGNLITLD